MNAIQLTRSDNGRDVPLWVCEKCGKWVDEIDRLAPYHMEMNRCYRCDPRKKKQSS